MEEIVKQLYEHRVKSFDRQIKIVEIRLQFVNWLFGVSSASLFGAFAIVRSSSREPLHFLLNPDISALAAGCFALAGILFTYFAKKEGNISIESVIKQLTYLDIEVSTFLAPNLPKEDVYTRVGRFMDDDYLDLETKTEMKRLDGLYERKHNELFWQGWLLKSVAASLLLILVSMTQSVIAEHICG